MINWLIRFYRILEKRRSRDYDALRKAGARMHSNIIADYNYCWQVECEELVLMVAGAVNLLELKATVKRNFPTIYLEEL